MFSARKHDTNISIMNINYARLYYIQVSLPDLREKYVTADPKLSRGTGALFV